jgi:hypothetical protein
MPSQFALTMSAAALAVGAFAFGTGAHAQSGVQVGTLTCNVDSGWGFVFGSSRGLRCVYAPVRGAAERYSGAIDKYGVDIGYVQGGVIVWGVIAPTTGMTPGALAGDYGGVTGSATVAVGVGANVLFGGFNKSITLQPLSIEGNTGLNLAAGIAAVTLKRSAQPPSTARDPDGLYQLGMEVGTAVGATIDTAHSSVTFQGIKSVGKLDPAKDVEYRDFVLQCNGLASEAPVGRIPGLVVSVAGGVQCQIIRQRE